MLGKSKRTCTVFHILSVSTYDGVDMEAVHNSTLNIVHRQTKNVNQKQGQSEIGQTVANSF